MFVKFSCGCVGFPPGSDGYAVVVHPCDVADTDYWEPLSFSRRDIDGKGYEPLPPEAEENLLHDLARLMGDGYRFRRIKSLLA